MLLCHTVERVDGTQARLKQMGPIRRRLNGVGGKGGWDSGEIETYFAFDEALKTTSVERVDGTQARLKHFLLVSLSWLLIHVERGDGTQARLKPC